MRSLSQANKIGKINLAATGKDLMDDEKQGDVTIDLYAAIDMENQAVNEYVSDLENIQTLGLLTGCLVVDDWYVTDYCFSIRKRGNLLLFFSLYIKIFFFVSPCACVDCLICSCSVI